jgi:hypothetical protein
MYSVQNALEQMFKRAHERRSRHAHRAGVRPQRGVEDLMHYGRVRTVGQFYQLDPYLDDNGEYRGHATGSFPRGPF